MANDLTAATTSPLDAILADPEKLKDLPVETMERLFALQREARSDMAREAYAVAFHALQGDLTPVRKRAKNSQTGSMYANAEAVNAMLDPVLHSAWFQRVAIVRAVRFARPTAFCADCPACRRPFRAAHYGRRGRQHRPQGIADEDQTARRGFELHLRRAPFEVQRLQRAVGEGR